MALMRERIQLSVKNRRLRVAEECPEDQGEHNVDHCTKKKYKIKKKVTGAWVPDFKGPGIDPIEKGKE